MLSGKVLPDFILTGARTHAAISVRSSRRHHFRMNCFLRWSKRRRPQVEMSRWRIVACACDIPWHATTRVPLLDFRRDSPFMYRVLSACLLLSLGQVSPAHAESGAPQPATPTHHEPDPCEINVLVPGNVLVEFPVTTPRAVAVQALIRDLGLDENTAGRAFDRAVEDQKRSCGHTWRSWLPSW